MNFTEMRLSEPILRAVTDEGYVDPTPIQAQAIPEALAGRDVLGTAQTGTGKTCAFALPILHALSEGEGQGNRGGTRRRGRSPRSLILCPTRELATQIHERFCTYGRHLDLQHVVVYGGVAQGRQVRSMQRGADVVVATPGRLLDLVSQGHVDLASIEILVLDEADRMLDMGFIPDIRKVVDLVPSKRQTLFFSATLSRDIRKLSGSILSDPIHIETSPGSATVEAIRQVVYMAERKQRAQLLKHLLQRKGMRRALVFTRTKYGADKLAKVLWRSGIGADAIHGNKSQNARFRALEAFRSGEKPILVATDIASRGIDVDEITHVFNYDMPIDVETYVHRIGRTARAGASGVAISFCGRNDRDLLRSIKKLPDISLKEIHDLPEMDEDDVPQHMRRKASPKTIAKERARDAERSSGRKKGGTPGPRRKKKRKKASQGNTNGGGKGKGRKKARGTLKGMRTEEGGDESPGRGSGAARKGRKKTRGSSQGSRKKAGRSRTASSEDGPVSKRRKKTGKGAKLGKAKWKARAATAGKKGKLQKARRRKNSEATPGHRGSPGYRKKTRRKKG
ncbi:MAG: DEAD/DEAH box helicase [Planctomycetota bacterium]|nr:DEAD/DEAH box helicase [Planctomycetota bacterium]